MSRPSKGELIAEGKAKQIYATSDPDRLIFYFKDDATAFNAQKRGTIDTKGVLNNRISSHFFRLLSENGIANHFIEHLNDREMLVQRLSIIPVETVCRNIVAGSLQKRSGHPEGEELPNAIVEYYYKDDELGDPMINDEHILTFGWAQEHEIREIHDQALAVNRFLKAYMAERDVLLVDFKLEFGRTSGGQVMLGDEICPDTCRFWDARTHKKLDKDRFRQDLGDVRGAYEEIAHRVGV